MVMSSMQESAVHSTPQKEPSLEHISEEDGIDKLASVHRATHSRHSTPGGRKSGDRTPLKGASPGRFNRSIDWRRREVQGSPTKNPQTGDSDVFGSPSSASSPSDRMTPGTIYSPDDSKFKKFKRSLRGSITQSSSKLSPRSDVDAQAIFLPSACVFVANLPAGEPDETLEAEVFDKFHVFGTVHVKIRRDAKQMPYAFCQFENDESAAEAVTQGPKLSIRGRPCRTEHARVNRTLFVSLKTNVRPETAIIRRDFEPMGDIDEISYPSTSDINVHALRNGAWVKFKYWQHAKDAFNHFRTNRDWIVEWPDNSSGVSNYDEFSIFVGNLDPERTKVPEIHELFKVFGEIDNVDINVRPSKYHGQQDNCFAFIRFCSREAVSTAIHERHGYEYHGRRLQVYRKEVHPKQSSLHGSFLTSHFRQKPFMDHNRMALEQMRATGLIPPAYPFAPFAGWVPVPPFSPISPLNMSPMGPTGEPWSPAVAPQKAMVPAGAMPQISLINGQYYHVLPDINRPPIGAPPLQAFQHSLANLQLSPLGPVSPMHRSSPTHNRPVHDYEHSPQYPYANDFHGPVA